MIRRARRLVEVFGLRCWQCCCEVEIPAHTVVNRVGTCTVCGAKLQIQWRDAD